jgi:hypothetical protein
VSQQTAKGASMGATLIGPFRSILGRADRVYIRACFAVAIAEATRRWVDELNFKMRVALVIAIVVIVLTLIVLL